MNWEADAARAAAINFEGWKWKITEQTGGKYRIPFDVKSEDLPESIKNAPVGTRFMIVVVELNDDETPRIAPTGPSQPASARKSAVGGSSPPGPKDQGAVRRPWASLPYSTRAAIRCDELDFRTFLDATYPDVQAETTDAFLKAVLGIQSKAQLTPGSEEASRFEAIDEAYREWKHANNGPPIEAYERDR